MSYLAAIEHKSWKLGKWKNTSTMLETTELSLWSTNQALSHPRGSWIYLPGQLDLLNSVPSFLSRWYCGNIILHIFVNTKEKTLESLSNDCSQPTRITHHFSCWTSVNYLKLMIDAFSEMSAHVCASVYKFVPCLSVKMC